MIKTKQRESSLAGISNLKLETGISLPDSGEVLAKINSVSLNYKDGETVEGLFCHHKAIKLPEVIVPCGDAAGQIWVVGDAITRWMKRDRVLSIPYLDSMTGKVME